MPSSYRVYSQTSPAYGASVYYRVLLPLHMMERMGLPMEAVYDWSSCEVSPQERIRAFLESDINLLYQAPNSLRLNLTKQANEFKPLRDADEEIRWPPILVADTDDDLFNVQPLNPAYGTIGIRRPDGTPLEDGDTVGIAHPAEVADEPVQEQLNKLRPAALANDIVKLGDTAFIYCADGLWHLYLELWKDCKEADGSPRPGNADWASNRGRMEVWKEILEIAHLVTCSTPRVAEYVTRECPTAKTFVSPNAIDFDDYPSVELRDHPGEVRILWQGSMTHHEDLWPLNDSIKRIAEKYPETKWVFFGAPYTWAVKNVPPERVTIIPWCHFEAYKPRLSMINHDINLAPLAPNVFNDKRSEIKFTESSAICKPAATLAQNWGAYRDVIQEGETGLLFNTPQEFEDKLSTLIENEKLRKTLASNAKDWVRDNRDAKRVMLKLFQKWSEVREEYKLTKPPPLNESIAEPERVVKIDPSENDAVTTF